MYLNRHSFKAKCKHENMFTILVTIPDQNIEDVRLLLDDLKEFNNGTDVIFTCERCETCIVSEDSDIGSNIYENTIWKFAYKTADVRNNIVKLIINNGGKIANGMMKFINVTETKCPFIEE